MVKVKNLFFSVEKYLSFQLLLLLFILLYSLRKNFDLLSVIACLFFRFFFLVSFRNIRDKYISTRFQLR